MSRSAEFDWQAVRARLAQGQAALERTRRSEAEQQALYRERAAMLAAPLAAPVAEFRIVTFRLGEERYALPLESVSETVLQARLALAPGAAVEIAGFLQNRGDVCVVWDLHRLLRHAGPAPAELSSVLLLRHAAGLGGGHVNGLVVGAVDDVRGVSEHDRKPAPVGDARAAWMTGDGVVVLNVQHLFARLATKTPGT